MSIRNTLRPRPRPRLAGACASLLLLGGFVGTAIAPAATAAPTRQDPTPQGGAQQTPTMQDIVPAPVKVRPVPNNAYEITSQTKIYTQPGSTAAAEIGKQLANIMRPSTGYPLPVAKAAGSGAPRGIFLLLRGAGAKVGDQGYRMNVRNNAIVIRANEPAGLFAGVQTLRQLLPAKVERDSVQQGPWIVTGGHITDYPRFGYRGAMLDVARHFFGVNEVKRYIDLISMYKINYLHLHLTDDQGWRIMIDSWPRLAKYGGSTEVDGGPGGYYTKAEYKEIVEYAQQRHITIVPEIDMPGHTNAALASYGKLNCDGTPTDLYTGIQVGFSSLCIDKEITYEFIDDVIRELAAMTPGPYIHIGGDEAHSTSAEDYAYFMKRAQKIVRKYGKIPRGWHNITGADLTPRTQIQFWGTAPEAPDVAQAAKEGHKLVMSTASRVYLDMKYNENSRIGNDWAGFNSVRNTYSWDPGSYLNGVDASSVLGIEAPLWTEFVENVNDIEYLTFPQIPAVAELGWSSQRHHDWQSFRERLAAQGERWKIMDVNFYRSPQVPWKG